MGLIRIGQVRLVEVFTPQDFHSLESDPVPPCFVQNAQIVFSARLIRAEYRSVSERERI